MELLRWEIRVGRCWPRVEKTDSSVSMGRNALTEWFRGRTARSGESCDSRPDMDLALVEEGILAVGSS